MVKIKPPGTPPSPATDASSPETSTPRTQPTSPQSPPAPSGESAFEKGGSNSFRSQPGESMPQSPVTGAFKNGSGSSALSVQNQESEAEVEEEFFDALESLEEAQALLEDSEEESFDATEFNAEVQVLLEEPDEEYFDALETLDTELFRFGDLQMSRVDIKTTIKIIEVMESILIGRMDRLLAKENNPRGVRPQGHHQSGYKYVPAPEGGQRFVAMRSQKDSVESVKDRFLTRRSRTKLRHLAEKLPNVTVGDGTKKTESEFKKEILRVLNQPRVEVYQLRGLLPIKESGSLAGSPADGGKKPPPEYERVTSNQLKETARDLGVMK